MSDTYMTSEELLEVLARKVPDSGILKDSVMYIDNFIIHRRMYILRMEQTLSLSDN